MTGPGITAYDLHVPEAAPHPLFAGGVLDELGAAARTVAADPQLAPLWDRLVAHADALRERGWDFDTAAAALVGAVLLPVESACWGGGLNRRVRGGINMERREAAAVLALRLADLLDEIEREPLPPDQVLSALTCMPKGARDALGPRVPSFVWAVPMAEALRELADGLRRAPDLANAPGLASRKPSWRDGLRETVANLAGLGFAVREADAARLAVAATRALGGRAPTRDAVRAAMRAGNRD